MPEFNQVDIATGAGLTGGPILIGATTINLTQTINAQTGTSYTVASTDNTSLITFNNASAVAVTLPVTSTTGFGSGFFFQVQNYGAGTVTITPTTSKINNGASSLSIPKNMGALITSDGSNYQVAVYTNITVSSSGFTTPVLQGYIGGLTLSNDGTSPNTVIDVATGICAESSVTFWLTLASAFKKTTSSWASGSGNGGLDTGSVAASTWYHVFVIGAGSGSITSVDVLISASATSPTLPSGYSYFRRIGSFKTNSSSNIITFTQDGNTFYWGTQLLDVSSSTPGTSSRTLYTLSVPSGVKVRPLGRWVISASLAASIIITSPDETDIAPQNNSSSTIPLQDSTVVTASFLVDHLMDSTTYTNTSSQIGARSNGGTLTFSFVTRGWVDDLGVYN